jgi:hypothetical protein
LFLIIKNNNRPEVRGLRGGGYWGSETERFRFYFKPRKSSTNLLLAYKQVGKTVYILWGESEHIMTDIIQARGLKLV